jgi:hypothetical protein
VRSPFANILRPGLLAIIVGLAVLAVAAPASAATPCWEELIDDWWDGRIDNVYAIPCYQKAIDNAPEDARLYSSLPDDIAAARQLALAQQNEDDDADGEPDRSTGGTAGGGTSSGGTGGGTGGNDGSGASGGTGGSTADPEGTGTTGRGAPDDSLFNEAFGRVAPANADSLPLPLLILAGLALLLLAGGSAGLVARRLQARRVRADRPGLPPASPHR